MFGFLIVLPATIFLILDRCRLGFVGGKPSSELQRFAIDHLPLYRHYILSSAGIIQPKRARVPLGSRLVKRLSVHTKSRARPTLYGVALSFGSAI